MSVALILAGHGSHISPNTAGVVWGYVDALRRSGIADEVTACFWKEQPHFNQVLRTVKSDTAVIVPVFTAKGYFSQQVIPSEMGFVSLTSTKRNIFYTRTLGEHPYLETIVQQRVRDAIDQANLACENTAVAVIGHGTARSTTTRETTIHQMQQVQKLGMVAQVVDAYLDDDPSIPSVYERTEAENLVVVPFFLAEGSHTTQDVPNALGIEYGDYPANINGRSVFYTPPIGTDDVICDLITQLARDTGLPFVEHPVGDVWSGFPQAGWNELLAHVTDDTVTFAQLQISQNAIQPIDSSQTIKIDNPSELRRHVRENPFRSLTSSDDLPADWIVPIDSFKQVPAIVETVYPGAIADWAANRRGGFQAEALANIIGRQQAMFKSLSTVDTATIAHHVSSVCGRCLRHPTWYEGQTSPDRIPCSSACNHWLSSIKEAINEG